MNSRMTRKIPATMATQHPDNASAPYWETDGDGFVSVQEELTECVSAYRDLDAKEFMWDWEGKYADEAVIDKLFSKFYPFCKKNKIGRDRFLTFRVPNIWHEKGYSLIRSLMVILTSEDFANDLGFVDRPLFEVILPMVENAEQLLYIQSSYRKLARFKQATFNHHAKKNTEYLGIIPLVESVGGQWNIKKLLSQYADLHKKEFHSYPQYLRPFLARSDPALVSGLLATVLANKVALSEIADFSREYKIPCFPIVGVGSLVFRGGLSPDTCRDFLRQYAGVRTVTIQSGFRYDYPLVAVRRAISFFNKELKKTSPVKIAVAENKKLESICNNSARLYQGTLNNLIKDVVDIFEAVPRRRERKLHVGFLSYGRSAGKMKLPRAINFTAAFYSLGIPPEFIGIGRTLASLSEAELELVKKYYVNITKDMERAGRYLNKENLSRLIKTNPAWRQVAEDVEGVEEVLGIALGPKSKREQLHRATTLLVFLSRKDKQKLSDLIAQAGKLRRSLG